MGKPRKLTSVEQEIINAGGSPGTPASVTTIHQAKSAETPSVPTGDPGVQRPIMVRFNPTDFAAVAASANRLAAELNMKVSLNAWIVSACREKLEREK